MDKRCFGDTFGDFDRKYCVGESSLPDSTSYDNTTTVYSSAKKKRVSKIVGGGLRQFSVIVCEKVARKGRTTYGEVADEIIAEFSAREDDISPVLLDEFAEKNIRRRVYDALNVLMALDIISKDRKEIQWKGLHITNVKDMEHAKALRVKLMNRIGKKASYLTEIEEQIAGLQDLKLRNQQLLKSGIVPSAGIPLPFILVQTSPDAMVEIEISEDMRLVHFDFNSKPFSLHDDASVLKLLRHYQFPESRHIPQHFSLHSSSNSQL